MKKLKNTTASAIQIHSLGLYLLPNQTIEATAQEYDLWTYAIIDDQNFIDLVNNGSLQVWNDLGSLSPSNGIKHLKRFQPIQEAIDTPFESSGLEWTEASNVQDAIEECYTAAKGIKTFPFELHYVSGTGLNTSMSNGNFFRVRPGTFLSGSYSGYPAAFPLQMPFNCKLYSIVLTFREASFDWNATGGSILFELEFRNHFYNGSDIKARLLVTIPGSFQFSSTGTDTFRYELFSNNFSVIDSGLPNLFGYGDMIGVRFVKAPSGDRRINSFRDIVMKLNFEEVISQ